ncbi:MAG: hypothetical protein D6744_05175 [Planctomycetota bacterium]|nr:MAG: hypothetical protein D6744_05175 [Planctomycetota bacterium]
MATTLVGFGLVALVAWPAIAQNRGRVTRDFAKIAAAVKESKISLVQAIQAVEQKVKAPVIGAKSDIENDVLVYYVNCWINEKLTPVKVNSDNGEIAVIATVRAKPDAPQNVTPASKPTETPDAEKP